MRPGQLLPMQADAQARLLDVLDDLAPQVVVLEAAGPPRPERRQPAATHLQMRHVLS